ncbi:MAG TPA: DUF177 domain-containing protein [Verrucomicrobiota bacterium]|nr:DUF177 domain-containing protein [Verrucomicrobiota bacterium]
MPLIVNLRHLVAKDLSLKGELPAADLDIDERDELVRVQQPLRYDLTVQRLEQSLLLRGRLVLTLDCLCVRCLKPVKHELKLDDWVCHVELEGEEAAPVEGDCVDLTPYMREDILLTLPQHPLCGPQCKGLKKTGTAADRKPKSKGAGRTKDVSSAWAELDKLKF